MPMKTLPGRYSKSTFRNLIQIYRTLCGEGEHINKIYDYMTAYANMDPDDEDFVFHEEASVLKQWYKAAAEYEYELADLEKELASEVEKWKQSLSGEKPDENDKDRDSEYTLQYELIKQRQVFINDIKKFITSITEGSLDESACPFDVPDYDERERFFSALELPLMTHVPSPYDIDESDSETSVLKMILRNICAFEPFALTVLFHDYNNGYACVRLWEKEDDKYVPLYYTVKKSDVYAQSVGEDEQTAIWPDIISEAVDYHGIDDNADALAEAILGDKISIYDVGVLSGGLVQIETELFEAYNNSIQMYVKCFADAYVAMVHTCSVLKDADETFSKLLHVLTDMIYYLVCCLDQTAEVAAEVSEILKTAICEYRAVFENKDPGADDIIRLSVCDTIEEMLSLFENGASNPKKYFETKFTKKLVASWKQHGRKNLMPGKTADELVELLLSNSTFVEKLDGINTHLLNHPTNKVMEMFMR